MADTRGLHPAEKVADYRAKGWWGDQTLDGIFADQVAPAVTRSPSSTRPTARRCSGRPPRRLTWRELDDEVTSLAARLLSLGLGRGDVLGVQLPNSVELVEVYLAAWRLGVVVSPLPVQLREREVATMCARADVTAYLSCGRFGDRALAADAATALAEVDSVRAVVAYGRRGGECGRADRRPRVASRGRPPRAAARRWRRMPRTTRTRPTTP